MTIKESIILSEDSKTVLTKNGVNLKGVRKILQDFFKEHSKIGGWEFWFVEDDGEHYKFEVHNFQITRLM